MPQDSPHLLARWLDRDPAFGHAEIKSLFEASLADTSANRLAEQWGGRYLAADAEQRRSLLAGLGRAVGELQKQDDKGVRLFRRLYAQSGDLGLLVDMRADMRRLRKEVGGLSELEAELVGLLSSWFDVGMLELQRIDWDSPASLLEKLIQSEAVHEIKSWDDLRRRVAPDRRCYAFFHPRMRDVPLIFVEVALSEQMAGTVRPLLDPVAPTGNLDKTRWAIFYSISNTQPGLRGISFGNFLLKRVINELHIELPNLNAFATLSPVPGFADWLERQDAAAIHGFVVGQSARQVQSGDRQAGKRWVERLRARGQRGAGGNMKKIGLRLLAEYLTTLKDGQPIDPVARFHLGNGASIERINWAADASVRGVAQSCGMMVNYLYEPERLDDNRARLKKGKPRISRAVRRL